MIQLRRQTSCSPARVSVVLGCCLLAFALLLSGAVLRTFVQSDLLESEAVKRYLGKSDLDGERGRLLDRNGRPLAASGITYSVHVNPRLFRSQLTGDQPQSEPLLPLLANWLDIEVAELDEKLQRDSGFAYLRKGISPEQRQHLAGLLRERGIAHIGFEAYHERYYPSAQEAAHLIGFIDHQQTGREGLEALLQPRLAPQPGFSRYIKSQDGQAVEIIDERSPANGEDIWLTIDARLQYLASAALANIVERHDAESASLVMIDAYTGEVLVMANFPSYNPNMRTGNPDHRRNRVVQDTFEPGSTMKPIITALAIESGLVKPETMLATGKPLVIGRNVIKDEKIDTDISVQEMIMRSSNNGAGRIAGMIDDDAMWQGYRNFGFGDRVLLSLPGETPGRLRHYSQWKPIDKASMSWGYSLSSNLLQLARAYAVFANGGRLVAPRLVVDENEKTPEPLQIISPKTATAMVQIMETVTSDKGTAPRARISGYRVAGKTGTALKWSDENTDYSSNVYQSMFVGLAPASDPRFVGAVFVDTPRRNGYYGGTVAAPVFARIMEHALRLYSVPPDLSTAPDGSFTAMVR